MSLGVATVGI